LIFRFTKDIVCTNPAQCNDQLVTRIQNATGLKLRFQKNARVQEAYIQVVHRQNKHLVIVVIYDGPQHEFVQSKELQHFRKVGVIKPYPTQKINPDLPIKVHAGPLPTEAQIESSL